MLAGNLLVDEPPMALYALTRIEMQSPVEQTWQAAAFAGLIVTNDTPEPLTSKTG